MNGEKKYTNVVDVDDGTRCYGENINAGRASPSCNYKTNAAFPLSLNQPSKIVFVSEKPSVIQFNDVIVPTEAHALLDRVWQEAAPEPRSRSTAGRPGTINPS
ncbi:hypothetical protein [Komagataeibacter sp. NFXK3]